MPSEEKGGNIPQMEWGVRVNVQPTRKQPYTHEAGPQLRERKLINEFHVR